MTILHWKYLFSVLLPGNLMILVFFLLSEISMELTECFETRLVLNLSKFWCFLWRCNDCIPFWIIIVIFLAGRQHSRIHLVWCTNLPSVPGTGKVSESSATKEQKLASQSGSQPWRLSALTVCYKAASKCFVGNNRGDEGIDAVARNPAFMLTGVPALFHT